MQRDIDRLTARTFDLLVVGGGIYGLTTAADAAMRGLSVALVERGDFGSGASFNHLRTIHGGLRYLQTLDLARARESIRERRTLARIAPAALRPVPFVLPLPSTLARGPWAMRAGFTLDALLGRRRNEGLPSTHHLPLGSVLSPPQALEQYPELRGVPMAGAAVWHDYLTVDADRLTLSWAISAADHGAALGNYVEAVAYELDQGRCVGARVVDRRSGQSLSIGAAVTVNATGGAVDALLTPAGLTTGLPMLRAMNLVTNRPAGTAAIGGRTPSGRTLFMVPWQGRALVGTWESSRPCRVDDAHIADQEVAEFVAEVNRAFPNLALTTDDVTLVHRGVVPARVGPDGRVTLAGHEQIVDHATAGATGLFSIAGTKYTTARAVAERIVDRVVSRVGRAAGPCRTAEAPRPLPALGGDRLLAHAAAHEMVITLEDAVVRRTPLGAAGYPGDAPVAHAAGLVGGVLGWSPERCATEAAALRSFYGTRKALKT